MYGFVSPNLDLLKREELMDLRKILGRLTDYCDQRITLLGGMGDAALCQQRMDEIYASLPTWAQWPKQARDAFTLEAATAINRSQQVAEKAGSSTIGTVHLLLGVLSVIKLQLDVEPLLRDARALTLPGGDGKGATFTPGAKKVIETAFDEARREKAPRINPQHLLAALAHGEGRAAQILQQYGLTPEVIRALR